jgi:hypothetical protein
MLQRGVIVAYAPHPAVVWEVRAGLRQRPAPPPAPGRHLQVRPALGESNCKWESAAKADPSGHGLYGGGRCRSRCGRCRGASISFVKRGVGFGVRRRSACVWVVTAGSASVVVGAGGGVVQGGVVSAAETARASSSSSRAITRWSNSISAAANTPPSGRLPPTALLPAPGPLSRVPRAFPAPTPPRTPQPRSGNKTPYASLIPSWTMPDLQETSDQVRLR